jgi:hypothetical protein
MHNVLRKIIREQINLLFESFEMKNDNKNYTPTGEVARIAQIALEAINVAKQKGIELTSLDETGNQGSGRLKAKQLSQKSKQSFVEMKRLKSFFESNSMKVEEERKKLGIIQQRRGTIDEMIKSNILLVWNLHGGDPCKKWVTSKLADTHKQGVQKKDRLRQAGGAYKNNGMGVFQTQFDPSQQRIHR